ncbi:MAG: tetratricopeptide repeat protein [Actinobacteria bacterium]|nr:tetratricopeptide repeat protein [Actinomycetota bacterium]
MHSDPPDAYLPGDRRRALATGIEMPDRVHGSALFADISGFTPLTEALVTELGAMRGPEELTAQIDRVFHAVIDEVHRYGGEVIYFSGDAITCWLDGDDGTRAAACGLAIQQTMTRVSTVTTPGGRTLQLAIKVAVAVGAARRFVVGDPTIQLIDVLAGRLIDELADAEHLADKGDVVLAASAIAALEGRVERRDHLLLGLTVDVPAPSLPDAEAPLEESLVRQWLLPAVYERLISDRGAYLAELRPAYPVFVRFGGIDFDDDPDAITALDGFLRGAQEVLTGYGGNLLQLTLGDKGAYLYAVFGSPVAHEDDAARACAAALDLLALETTTAATDLQIGVTTGRLRSGTYGHPMRRTFVCLGDAVNLSARLMSRAPAGSAYVADEVRRVAGDRFETTEVGEMTVKGKSIPVLVHSLIRRRTRGANREVRYPLPMVGRVQEMTVLREAVAAARAGRGQVVAVTAEAGRGKSRLVAEAVREMRAAGLPVAFGEAAGVGRSASYSAWGEVWQTMLGLDPDASDAVQGMQLNRVVGALDRRLLPRVPLLGEVLGIDLPDTPLTASFDAKLRKTSLESLLVELFEEITSRAPHVVVIEDSHAIDALSLDLLHELVRASDSLPALFVVAGRPDAMMDDLLGLREVTDRLHVVELGELDGEQVQHIVAGKAAQLFGVDVVPAPELVAFVAERAQGNPFYVEELLSFVKDMGHDPTDPTVLSRLYVPDSLHRLVLGRIDLLPETPRTTVKVASVAGRAFESPFVRSMNPELGSDDDVEGHLAVVSRVDLVTPVLVEDRSWIFRHPVTRDVAYDSLPFALRARLHRRAAESIEEAGVDEVERQLEVLAHHSRQGEDVDRQRTYLVRAGVAAQHRYANADAAHYYSQALEVLEPADQTPVLRRLGKVLELAGRWADAEAIFQQGAALAESLDDRVVAAWCRADLGENLRKQARFDDAAAALAEAKVEFERVGEQAGVGTVLHVLGTIASQRGDYDEARSNYEASLVIRRSLGDRAAVGSLLSNLGLVAENLGDLDEAVRYNEEALAVRQEVGERWAISISQNNLGMMALAAGDFALASTRFAESMRLADEVGDRWVVAVGHHNLGNAFVGLGELDRARSEFAAAWEAYDSHDDEWSLTLLAEDVVPMEVAAGRLVSAAQLMGAADAIRERLQTPRPPSVQAVIDGVLEPHRVWWDSDGVRERLDGADMGLTLLERLLAG